MNLTRRPFKFLFGRRFPIVDGEPVIDGPENTINIFRDVWSILYIHAKCVPFSTLIKLPKVRSIEEFRKAWESWPFSSFNMVYADAAGNTVWQLVGDIPIRSSVNATLPSQITNNWQEGLVPHESLPRKFNPDTGILATANSEPSQLSTKEHYLGQDWIDGY